MILWENPTNPLFMMIILLQNWKRWTPKEAAFYTNKNLVSIHQCCLKCHGGRFFLFPSYFVSFQYVSISLVNYSFNWLSFKKIFLISTQLQKIFFYTCVHGKTTGIRKFSNWLRNKICQWISSLWPKNSVVLQVQIFYSPFCTILWPEKQAIYF